MVGFATPALAFIDVTPPPASTCVAGPLADIAAGTTPTLPGRWVSPEKIGTGWDVMYTSDNQSFMMIWYTYDAQGRPRWLTTESNPIDHTSGRWTARLLRSTWNASLQRDDKTVVGSVAVQFIADDPNQMALRWQWDEFGAEGQQTECVQDIARGDLNHSVAERGVNSSFSGAWYEPQLGGWGDQLSVVRYTDTPDGIRYFESHGIAVYDTNNNPVWVQGGSPTCAASPEDNQDEPVPLPICQGPSPLPLNGDFTFTLYYSRLFASTSKRLPIGTCRAHMDCGEEFAVGTYWRNYINTNTGYARLRFSPWTVAGDTPVAWRRPATGDNTIVIRKLTNENQILVDRTSCDAVVGLSGHASELGCEVVVDWGSGVSSARAYRIDLVTGIASLLGDANNTNVGESVQWLPAGSRVQFELRSSASAGYTVYSRTSEVRARYRSAFNLPADPPAITVADPTAAEILASDTVGATPATFRVDESGAATYSVPIALPTGTGGLTPSLTLRYSSASGDGVAGAGWQLAGPSMITRCRSAREFGDAPAVADDFVQFFDPIRFTAADQFCLDGQRLIYNPPAPTSAVPTPPAHGADGAEYRTEIDSFARITIQGISAGEPVTFKVEGKDGTVRYFGSTAAGKLRSNYVGAPGTVVIGWAEDKVVDSTRNNRVDYIYRQLTEPGGQYRGEQYLDAIHYDGTRTKVELAYARARSGGTDVTHTAGVPVTRNHLLTKITVKADARNGSSWTPQTLREYNLSYGTFANNAKRDRLNSIQECVGTTCLPATTFNWSAEPSLSAGQRTSQPKSNCADPQPPNLFCKMAAYRYGDVNGDGRTDIVWLRRINSNDEYEVRVSYSRPESAGLRFTGVGTSIIVKRENFRSEAFEVGRAIHVLDFDGDGRDDLIYADTANNSWMLRLAQSNGEAPVSPFGNAVKLNVALNGAVNATLADFSGDGMPDLLTTSYTSGIYAVSLAFMVRDASTGTSSFSTPRPVSFRSRHGAGCVFIAFNPVTSERHDAVDVDGDGRAELQVQSPSRDCGASLTSKPMLEIQNSDAFEAASGNNSSVFVSFFRLSKEGSSYIFSLGSEFEVRSDQTRTTYFRVGDINADGLVDIVYREPQGLWYFDLNNGRGFNRPACVFSPSTGTTCRGTSGIDDKLLQLLDFDGDGRLDVWVSRGNTNAAGERLYDAYLWTGSGFAATSTATPFLAYESVDDWRRSFADLDGDGRLDNLLIKPFDSPSTSGDGSWHAVRSNLPYKPVNVMERIEDGLGAQTQITYAPMTFSSVYRRDLDGAARQSWRGSRIFDISMPGYVVRRVEASAPSVNNNADGTGESTCVAAPASGAEDTCVSGISYRYRGLKIQTGGRSSLGFRKVLSLDLQNLIETETTYAQGFPLTGSPTSTVARKILGTREPADNCQGSTGVTATPDSFECMMHVTVQNCAVGALCEDASTGPELSRQSSEWHWRRSGNQAPATLDPAPAGSGRDTMFVFRSVSSTQKREVPTNSVAMPIHAGESLQFVTYDAFGNVTLARARTFDGDPSTATAIQLVETVSTFANDADKWHLGRLTASEVRTTRGTEQVIRATAFTYDSVTGQLLWERLQPTAADVSQQLKTRYHRDAYGNVIRKVVCSQDVSDSVCEQSTVANVPFAVDDIARPDFIQRVSATMYDAQDGRHPVAKSEPFSTGCKEAASCEVERVVQRDGFGNALRRTLLNGRSTQSAAGALGRVYLTQDNAGSHVVNLLRWCVGTKGALLAGATPVACPVGSVFRTEMRTAGAPTSWTYHDRLGRVRTAMTQGLGSTEFRATQTDYDWLGRVSRQAEPFMAMGPSTATPGSPTATTYWTRTWYDIYGRALQVQHPEHTATFASRTNISYAGLTTVTLLPANNTPKRMPNGANGFGAPVRERKEERRNSLDEIVGIVEHTGHYATYEYMPTGELKSVVRRASTAGGAAELARSRLVIDALGRKIGTVNDALDDFDGAWTYRYNALGELVEQQSPRGAKTTLRYDARGRPFRRVDELAGSCGGAVSASETKWSYDTSPGGLGQPAQTSKSTCGTIKYQRRPIYDAVGRVRSEDTAVTRYNGMVATYTDSIVYDGYGRIFQKFFQSSGDGMPITGEEYTYSDTGYLREMADAYRYLPGVKGRQYWRLLGIDARGNSTSEELTANARVVVSRGYAAETGLPTSVVAANAIQNLSINYDAVGNVVEKVEQTSLARRETFDYDAMQRLTSSTQWNYLTGTTMLRQTYDLMGNISTLIRNGSSMSYTYGTKPAGCARAPGPNALSVDGTANNCYDPDGNQVTTTLGRTVAYNAHGLPSRITYTRSNRKAEFDYGPSRGRLIRLDYVGTVATTPSTETHDLGSVEITRNIANGGIEVKRYVGSLIIVQTRQHETSTTALRRDYIFTDHQGSTHRVTDDFGTVRATGSRQSFDAFGMRRNPDTYVALSEAERWNFDTADTTLHGFTGHEQVDGLDIIHMNGRLYDPRTNRFIQSDPTILDAYMPQGLNSYSYAFNNPLRFTDPTGGWGYSEQSALRGAIAAAISVWTGYWGSEIGGISGAAVKFAGAVASGAVQSGSGRDALSGGLQALAFQGVGSVAAQLSPEAYFLAMTLTAGTLEELNGGDFGHGFLSASLGIAISPIPPERGPKMAEFVGIALVGGTVSELTGGNFANGAITAASSVVLAGALRSRSGELRGNGAGRVDLKAAARLKRHPVASYRSKDGESKIAFLKRAGAGMRAVSDETGFEMCAPVCEDSTGGYALEVTTVNSHAGCVTVTSCPVGFNFADETIHTHGKGAFKVNKVDAVVNPVLILGRRVTGQDLYNFSDGDFGFGPGYLATPSGLKYQNGRKNVVDHGDY